GRPLLVVRQILEPLRIDDRFGFDLNQHVRMRQAAYGQQCVGRQRIAEILVALLGDSVIGIDVADVGDGANDVVKCRANVFDAGAHRLAHDPDLRTEVADATDRGVRLDRGFSDNINVSMITAPHDYDRRKQIAAAKLAVVESGRRDVETFNHSRSPAFEPAEYSASDSYLAASAAAPPLGLNVVHGVLSIIICQRSFYRLFSECSPPPEKRSRGDAE